LRGAENLDVQQCLATLDRWTQHVEDETLRNYHRFLEHPEQYNHSQNYYRMMMLATVLQEDFQAHYDPARALPQLRGQHEPNDVFFADASDVFIHGILGGERHGTCSSLPVLYAAVAQRLGYPVNLVSAKEHLYLRCEEGTNHFNVDATGEGFISQPDEEYRHWPYPITDEEIKTFGYLEPVPVGHPGRLSDHPRLLSDERATVRRSGGKLGSRQPILARNTRAETVGRPGQRKSRQPPPGRPWG
jgi:hypothetical protein